MNPDLDRLYQNLPADAREVYRLLGHHPGPAFGSEMVAAALGIHRADAERRIDGLVSACLVIQGPDGYYRILQEAHVHAVAQAGQEGPDSETGRRMLGWYLNCARHANGLAMPGRRVWEFVLADEVPAVGGPPAE